MNVVRRFRGMVAIGFLLTIGSTATANYSGGTGEPNDPYQITTAADLIGLGETPEDYDKHFVLTADIDLDPGLRGRKAFDRAVIAPDTNDADRLFQGTPFTGTFDGYDHTISHLTIAGKGYLGLFGKSDSQAAISNLIVEATTVSGIWDCIGGLVGHNEGTITGCHSTGMVAGTGDRVGGLVGENDGSIAASHSTAVVTGYMLVGGLVGNNGARASIATSHSAGAVDGCACVGGLVGSAYGSITACYSAGAVTGQSCVGGLLGAGQDMESITCCYSTSAVTGDSPVGGLAGYIDIGDVIRCYSLCAVRGNDDVAGIVGNMETGVISECYSAGAVGGKSDVGGVLGFGPSVTVVKCLWNAEVCGQTTSAAGEGKTPAQMQTTQTFLDAGWDFVGETANGTDDVWWIREGQDYPRLSWEGPAGIVLTHIPAGTFQMGARDGVGNDSARPVHTVALDSFQISQCEITNAQYTEYLNRAMIDGLIQVISGVVHASADSNVAWAYCDTYASSPYSQIVYSQGRFTVRSRDGLVMSDHPVARVSWYGATAFCEYYGYHLPTEAEWEYAAQGGYHDPYYRYPWGSDDINCSEANCKTDEGFCNPLNLTSWPYTVPVGYYGPQGAYDLCDMSGNLWEWCQDWYDPGYYAVSPTSNPAGPATGTTRVLRGGAWDVHGDSCDVAGRSIADPAVRGQVVGFRVCR
jgi:formylglycine-generating enzyme required for sulfatase activity